MRGNSPSYEMFKGVNYKDSFFLFFFFFVVVHGIGFGPCSALLWTRTAYVPLPAD